MKAQQPWQPPRWAKVFLVLGVAGFIVGEYALLFRTLQPERAPERPSATASHFAAVPPAALGSTGAYVRSVVQPDGTIRVTQWVRVGAAVDQITLASYAADLTTEPPVAKDLQIVDGSGAVVVSEGEVGTEGRTVDLASSRELRLTYDLTGVVSMSGSVPGRAIATSTALEVTYPGQGPTTLEITGADVLTLACGGVDPTDLRPCGQPEADGWSVRLDGVALDDRVSAQLDLPVADGGVPETPPTRAVEADVLGAQRTADTS